MAKAWPTPTGSVINDGESLESWEARKQRNLAKNCNGNGMGTPLTIAAQLWGTPTSHERTHAPRDVANGIQLANQAATWATPTSRDWKDGTNPSEAVPTNGLLGRQAPRTALDGDAGSSKAVLSPSFVEALMGLPPSWTVPTVSAVSATPWSLWWRRWRSELLRIVL